MGETYQGAASALLVEDDAGLLAMLRRHLERAGFLVSEARTEREAMHRAEGSPPDVVILDLALAEGSGDAVCARLRAHRTLAEVPVLVLSARDDVGTKVGLLTIGADDYVVKPCDPAELIARVRRLIARRATGVAVRRIGRLRVALETGDAWVGDQQVELTAGERVLLTQLARSWPSATPRAALDQAPWRAEPAASSNVTEVLVTRLRKKLAAAASGVEILSVRRLGYTLRTNAKEART